MVVAEAVRAVEVVEVGAAPGPRPRRVLSPEKAERRDRVVRNLTDAVVIPEDERLLEKQYYAIFRAFMPRNRWQEWLTARIATLQLRINRAERVERKLRDWASYRAFDFWEDDQKVAAEALGQRLKRDPARVAAKLRQTPAGIDWLVGRWRQLAGLGPGDWTEERRGLAYRLLGGDERVDPAEPGFVAAQVGALEADRSRVEEADAIRRGLVESDLSDQDVPDLAKLRREARAWHRQVKWYVDQFHVEHPDRWDDPMRRPASEKVTPDGFREVDYNAFEGPRLPDLGPVAPPTPALAPSAGAPGPVRDESARIADRPEVPAAGVASEGLAAPRSFVAAQPPAPPWAFVAISASRPAPRPVVHDYSNEKGRGHARPLKAGELPRGYANRLKRARRRTSLALAGLAGSGGT